MNRSLDDTPEDIFKAVSELIYLIVLDVQIVHYLETYV